MKNTEQPPLRVRFALLMIQLAAAFFAPGLTLGLIELVTGAKILYLVPLTIMQIALIGYVLYRAQAGIWHDFGNKICEIVRAITGNGWRDPLALSSFTWCCVWFATIVIMMLGYPRGFEAQAYHLPIAHFFFSEHTLAPWGVAYMHSYYSNWSLFIGQFMGFLPEQLLSYWNIPWLLLATISVIGLAAHLDVRARLFAAFAFMSITFVVAHSTRLEADLMMVSFVALMLILLLSDRSIARSHLFWAGVAYGLAMGTKQLAILLVPFLWFFLAYRGWQRERFRGVIYAYGYFAVGWLLSVGFWLARATVYFANPLHPLIHPIFEDWFGWQIVPENNRADLFIYNSIEVEHFFRLLSYPWLENDKYAFSWSNGSGLGPMVALAIVPAVIVFVVSFVRGRIGQKQLTYIEKHYGWLLLVAIIFILFWIITKNWQTRYTLIALTLLCPLSGWFLLMQAKIPRRAFEWLFSLAIIFAALMNGSVWAFELASQWRSDSFFSRAKFYEYPSTIDHLPNGSVVLSLDSRQNQYALLGRDHHNRIVSGYDYFSGRDGMVSDFLPRRYLETKMLDEKGITHIYNDSGTREIIFDECRNLVEIDALRINRVNNVRLVFPRVLYKLEKCPQK